MKKYPRLFALLAGGAAYLAVMALFHVARLEAFAPIVAYLDRWQAGAAEDPLPLILAIIVCFVIFVWLLPDSKPMMDPKPNPPRTRTVTPGDLRASVEGAGRSIIDGIVTGTQEKPAWPTASESSRQLASDTMERELEQSDREGEARRSEAARQAAARKHSPTSRPPIVGTLVHKQAIAPRSSYLGCDLCQRTVHYVGCFNGACPVAKGRSTVDAVPPPCGLCGDRRWADDCDRAETDEGCAGLLKPKEA